MWETYENPKVNICGHQYEETSGQNFASVVKDYAKFSGYSKFRVFLVQNGVETEVESNNAPYTLDDGMEVTIKPYEKAA